MSAYAEKAQEHKNQAISNGGSQMQDSVESVFQFVDNRPEVAAQQKLKEMANNSTQAKQAAQLQTMVNNHYLQPQTIQKKENNTGLPDNLKSGIENLSGMSMDDVKVHKNSDQPAQLNAHAYAQGTDIHLGPGQEKHLPHEAWHVVQQKQGRVKPTMQMKGTVPVNDDAGLEKEADVMGAKSMKTLNHKTIGELKSSNAPINETTQRVVYKDDKTSKYSDFKQINLDANLTTQDTQAKAKRLHKDSTKHYTISEIKKLAINNDPIPFKESTPEVSVKPDADMNMRPEKSAFEENMELEAGTIKSMGAESFDKKDEEERVEILAAHGLYDSKKKKIEHQLKPDFVTAEGEIGDCFAVKSDDPLQVAQSIANTYVGKTNKYSMARGKIHIAVGVSSRAALNLGIIQYHLHVKNVPKQHPIHLIHPDGKKEQIWPCTKPGAEVEARYFELAQKQSKAQKGKKEMVLAGQTQSPEGVSPSESEYPVYNKTRNPNNEALPNPWANEEQNIDPLLDRFHQEVNDPRVGEMAAKWRLVDRLIQRSGGNETTLWSELISHRTEDLLRLQDNYQNDIDLMLGYPERVDEEIQRTVIKIINEILEDRKGCRQSALKDFRSNDFDHQPPPGLA